MISYQNPFRSRASEQQRDQRAFLKTFGPGAIELLPDSLWDRLLVLRSAPGAGKTSLMRIFTVESLIAITEREDLDDLSDRLTEVGGLGDKGPSHLGVLLNLERDYRALVDVVSSGETSLRLFFRLLDIRIIVSVMRAALTFAGKRFPDDAGSFRLRLREGRFGTEDAVHRLGGYEGQDIFETSRNVERSMLLALDSLIPVDWATHEYGHADLYSLRVISDADVLIDGAPLTVKPLIMLDDGHRLHRTQRDELLRRLADRDLEVARWYSERYEALTPKEILSELGQRGRDYELVELENVARGITPNGERQRFRPGRFERVLVDIGNRRAASSLKLYADEFEDFFKLLVVDENELLSGREDEILYKLRARLEEIAGHDGRYQVWLQAARRLTGYAAALRYRELEILIARDLQRAQHELIEFVLADAEADERSSSALREAAGSRLAQEFDLPYYAGTEMIPKLGSQNIEQFLSLSGDIFAEMLARITLQRRPTISPVRQDRIVKRASDLLWREIPRRIPHGTEVQQFAEAIVTMAREENAKPTMPYAPGVTGTALLMSDRTRLMNPEIRRSVPGADALFICLGEAVAHNIVSVELDQSVKGRRYMVIYLNRLLCPRFGLPLGRGGYREKRLEVMSKWMTGPPPPAAKVADLMNVELSL
jgi:hypothetical protein